MYVRFKIFTIALSGTETLKSSRKETVTLSRAVLRLPQMSLK